MLFRSGDWAPFTEGQTRPHLGLYPGLNVPLHRRQGSWGCIPYSPGESGLISRGSKGLTGASAPSLYKTVLRGLFSFYGLFKEFLFQPLTHRQVVEFIGSVGYEDGKYENADGYEDVRTQRGILMTIYPRHLHVDERIVGNIGGIAYFAQELVNR